MWSEFQGGLLIRVSLHYVSAMPVSSHKLKVAQWTVYLHKKCNTESTNYVTRNFFPFTDIYYVLFV